MRFVDVIIFVRQIHNIFVKKLSVSYSTATCFDFYKSVATQEFCSEGSANSVEDRGQREWGSGGGSPLVRGSGGSCNLVQEISFHIVKFS